MLPVLRSLKCSTTALCSETHLHFLGLPHDEQPSESSSKRPARRFSKSGRVQTDSGSFPRPAHGHRKSRQSGTDCLCIRPEAQASALHGPASITYRHSRKNDFCTTELSESMRPAEKRLLLPPTEDYLLKEVAKRQGLIGQTPRQ